MANPTISYCTFVSNFADSHGGAIYVEDSAPIIEYCTFINNEANNYGGAIYLNTDGDATIRYCTFSGNSAYYGGGIAVTSASIAIENCTMHANTGSYGGGMSISGTAVVTVVNTIVSGTSDGGGILYGGGADITLTYSDFYENTGGNFLGGFPAGLGQLTGVNANGDSCDVYHNIFADPLYISNWDFRLLEGSPCIDAGDPSYPYDPDNTVADIGAFFFDQRSPDIMLSTTLLDFGTVTVGEEVDLPLTIYNVGDGMLIIHDVFCSLPVFTTDYDPADSLLFSGEDLDITVTFSPDEATTFVDTLWIDNNDEICAVRLQGTGEPAGGIEKDGDSSVPGHYALMRPYPNPFNPTTTFRLELPTAGFVEMRVTDLTGCQVAVPIHGWLAAGSHELIFDASGLASGMYLYQVKAGRYTSAGKLVLLK